jgi:coproporphyrinogen III oxidase
MSLPPNVQWVYDHHPEVGSEEEKLVKVEIRDWNLDCFSLQI